jgi:membrane protease YdiL (CAAX protease family)
MTTRAEVLPTIGRVVAFAALVVACGAASYALFAPLAAKVISASGQPLRLDVIANLIGVMLATVIMLRAIDHRAWSAIDLDRAAASVRSFVRGFGMGAAVIVVVLGALLVTGLLRWHTAPSEVSWLGAAARVTLVLAPAALAEEVMCRGYLLTVVRECIGTPGAIALTSVLFGLLHLSNPDATVESVIVVVLAGVFLASVRIAMRSLYAAWMAHFAWNWVMAVPVHATVSGIRFEAPGYFAESTGPAWLSGGAWGPEGGIVAALGLIAALVFLYARPRREES